MIAVTNILESTRDKLKSLKDIPVYLDEVKESFKSPCFFLKTIKTTVPEKEFLYKKTKDFEVLSLISII